MNRFSRHLVLLALTAVTAKAAMANSSGFQYHGFISQGVMQAADSSFVNQDGEISFKLTEIGLNGSLMINDSLRVAGQVIYLNGDERYAEGSRLDYLLLDWSAYEDEFWKGNIRLGKFKNNHWIYSATRDVPHTRPSVVLPQSIYFDLMRDATLAIEGASTTVERNTTLGTFSFSISAGKGEVKESTKQLLSPAAGGSLSLDESVMTSLSFTPDSHQWLVNLAYTDADIKYDGSVDDVFTDGKVDIQRYIMGMVYSDSHWELTTELLLEKVDTQGIIFPGHSTSLTSQGGYIQGRFYLYPTLSLLTRLDIFDRDKNDRSGRKFSESTGGLVPAHFGYMDDLTIGMQWDIKPQLRLQAEFHRVHGTGRLGPTLQPNVAANENEYWNLWAIQLMYWF